MMIRCKTAAELLCQSLDSPLSRWQRLQLRLHLWLCRPCAEFAKQHDVILESIEKRFAAGQQDRLPDPQLEQLSREACEADHVVAFGSYPPMSVELRRVDPNGRWVEVEFEPDERAAHELPAKAWIHIQQITLITPDGPRSSR